MEITKEDIYEIIKTDVKIHDIIDELRKSSITGMKYDFYYYNSESKKKISILANRRQRGGFIVKSSVLRTSGTQANFYSGEDNAKAFRSLQNRFSRIPK